jgi:hypothetical protein
VQSFARIRPIFVKFAFIKADSAPYDRFNRSATPRSWWYADSRTIAKSGLKKISLLSGLT